MSIPGVSRPHHRSDSRLERLLRPRAIAVVGGGAWCANVIRECRKIGFDGPIWPVHPHRGAIAGEPAFRSVAELPSAPDATFIGVNRHATIDVARALAQRGAGGAVCFASAFAEAVAEDPGAPALQTALLDAAGEMPIFGPNCYGFLNALDGVALWPDQHGLARVDQGVAVISQSSNIALNLTMQRRGLPIAYLMTVGNQAQTGAAEIAAALLDDPRVTAIGLHLEGLGDIAALEALAEAARARGKPIVALKIGASEQARAAAVSHTAAMVGEDVGAEALLARLGIGRVSSPSAMLECLKLLHVHGPLRSRRIASMSCSGGEASLVADLAAAEGLACPALTARQHDGLRAVLGPKVALSNPLDYHTYIWGDRPAMAQCFGAMADAALALTCVVLDFPRGDRCETGPWDLVVDALDDARAETGAPMAILASLQDALPEATAQAIMARGIAPLAGLREALEAVRVAADIGAAWTSPAAAPVLAPAALSEGPNAARLLTEEQAKALLAAHGLDTPLGRAAASPEAAGAAAEAIGFPVALKGEGAAHKTEAGLLALGLGDAAAVTARADAMPAQSFLVEEMVSDGVAELLIGVLRDPAHGFVLTLGAGGVWTEILDDRRSLLIPAEPDAIRSALQSLRAAPVLAGHRGAPAADLEAIIRAVQAIQNVVAAHADRLIELEINPLICTPSRAVAVDALMRLSGPAGEPT